MPRQLIKIEGVYFDWPEGARAPASYAIASERLELYRAARGPLLLKEDASVVEGNTAGPGGRTLTQDELLQCYRDAFSYEAFFRAEGVSLLAEARN